eukprot:998966-Pyramimonas_sp.AAC.1
MRAVSVSTPAGVGVGLGAGEAARGGQGLQRGPPPGLRRRVGPLPRGGGAIRHLRSEAHEALAAIRRGR